jgi:hypothetical protein
MQAYKLEGTITQTGQLIFTEPINLTPGEVEVIILQRNPVAENAPNPSIPSNDGPSKKINGEKVKSLKELLEAAPPISADFDPEQARWEILREKYDL